MKFARIIFANLLRKKVRLLLTIGSFAVALFLFAFLAVVKDAFGRGADVADYDGHGNYSIERSDHWRDRCHHHRHEFHRRAGRSETVDPNIWRKRAAAAGAASSGAREAARRFEYSQR